MGTFALTTKGQQAQQVAGKYIVVWQKVGNEWKLATDIWNTNKYLPRRECPPGFGLWRVILLRKSVTGYQAQQRYTVTIGRSRCPLPAGVGGGTSAMRLITSLRWAMGESNYSLDLQGCYDRGERTGAV